MKTPRIAWSLLAIGLLALTLASHAPPASADLVFDVGQVFSGDAPAGSAPWLRATFKTTGVNTVSLTLKNLLQDAGEFVSEWYFNVDPAISAASLSFLHVSGDVADSIDKGTDAFKADGDGLFDIRFNFKIAPPANRFKGGETIVYTITGTGLTENSFNFLSKPDGGHGPFKTAAHVQGIAGGKSGWIAATDPIPEPAFYQMAALLGLGGLGALRLRKSRRS